MSVDKIKVTENIPSFIQLLIARTFSSQFCKCKRKHTLVMGLTSTSFKTFLNIPHSATIEISLLAHILQMLLASKINSHISANFCPDHQDVRLINKALNANEYKILWVISLVPET